MTALLNFLWHSRHCAVSCKWKMFCVCCRRSRTGDHGAEVVLTECDNNYQPSPAQPSTSSQLINTGNFSRHSFMSQFWLNPCPAVSRATVTSCVLVSDCIIFMRVYWPCPVPWCGAPATCSRQLGGGWSCCKYDPCVRPGSPAQPPQLYS